MIIEPFGVWILRPSASIVTTSGGGAVTAFSFALMGVLAFPAGTPDARCDTEPRRESAAQNCAPARRRLRRTRKWCGLLFSRRRRRADRHPRRRRGRPRCYRSRAPSNRYL